MHLSDTLATELLDARVRDRHGMPVTEKPTPGDKLDALSAIRTRCFQAMALSGAQSAGVSIFDQSQADSLIWIASCGVLAPSEGQRLVRNDSMCGICFAYRAPQLFLSPQRYFLWMAQAGIKVAEALVVPLFGPYGALYGTVWVMTHEQSATHFDREDARALAELGKGMYARIWAYDAARALAGENPKSN